MCNIPVISWTVRVIDALGTIQHEQTFHARPGHDAEATAEHHAERMRALFTECEVIVHKQVDEGRLNGP